jgi:rod shape-determining protein MreC
MKFVLSRSLQTTLVFLLVSGVLALALSGFLGAVSQRVTGGLVAAQSWISTRFLAMQDFLAAPRDIVSLRARNAELESQVSQLQAQVIELQQRVNETNILAALVDFSDQSREHLPGRGGDRTGSEPVPALRDHRSRLERWHSPRDAGRDEPGAGGSHRCGHCRCGPCPTRDRPGLESQRPASAGEPDAIGSVTGDMSLDMVSQDAAVEPGDLILTSGLGGGFPPDLIVGQVVTIRALEFELFKQATVQPAVDFSRLEIVLVITNFRPVEITPLEPETAQ